MRKLQSTVHILNLKSISMSQKLIAYYYFKNHEVTLTHSVYMRSNVTCFYDNYLYTPDTPSSL